jgi:hypothetical protein
MTISVVVTTGVPPRATPPKAFFRTGALAACSRTQSTHWKPTGAGRWHSAQAGRPHRWHLT